MSAEARTSENRVTVDYRGLIVRLIVVLLGIAVGATLAMIVGLVTGLIPFVIC